MKTIPGWIRWLCALTWTIFTLVLMLSPTIRLPSTFLGDLTDKAAHFADFGLLAALWYAVLIRYCPRQQALRITLGMVLIIGAFTELMQGMVPGRTTDFFDFAANAFGTGSGVGASYWVQGWRLRRLSN